eukprot:11455463-Alexandrium_andersonii.AAC.1
MRSLTHTQEVPKFGAKAIPGAFLGYKMQPGAKWSNANYVASLEDLIAYRNGAAKGVFVHETLGIVRDDASTEAVQFPASQGGPVVPSAVPRGALPVPPGP